MKNEHLGATLIGKECQWCSKDISHRNKPLTVSYRNCEDCDKRFEKCPKCGDNWQSQNEWNFRAELVCSKCGSMERDLFDGKIYFSKMQYIKEELK